MTTEARVLFVALFFATWAFAGLGGWAVVAVLQGGRGALAALPVCIAAACAAGVLVPLLGFQDATAFLFTVPAAVFASLLAYAGVLALLRSFLPGAVAPVKRPGPPPRE